MGRTTGELIRRERLARDQSQAEVALALGVAKSAVCQWEREVYEPSLEALRLLARAWKVPLHSLIGTRDAKRLAKRRRRARSSKLSAAQNGRKADGREARE